MKKVGFLLPNNEEIYMDYHEVNDFCKKVCEKDASFFKKEPSQFDCYFDYVMQQKGYIFIHPLFRNSYLVAEKDIYYSIDKSTGTETSSNKYRTIQQMLQTEEFEKREILMEEASNEVLNICDEEAFQEGFVSREGIFYDKTKSTGHWVLANTIAHQYLMKSMELGELYQQEKQGGIVHRSEFFLIRQFGFLEVDANPYGNYVDCLLLNASKISPVQKDYMERKLSPYTDFILEESSHSAIQVYYGVPKSNLLKKHGM